MSRMATEDPTVSFKTDEEITQEHRVEQLDFLDESTPQEAPYRLYKWRFVGLVGLALLNVGAGLNGTWLGPIANQTADEFQITVTQVNWLGNTIQLGVVTFSPIVPYINKRFGLRTTCLIGAIFLFVGPWLRYAGVVKSLSSSGKLALLFIGQIITAVSQPFFLSLGPFYSESWFDLKGRVTATMVLSICNPIGTAIAQILSPLFSTSAASLLVLAIISSVLALFALIIRTRPPTPPTYSGGKSSVGPMITVRAMFFREWPGESTMDLRDKIDFAVVILAFGAYVGATIAFSLLSNQILAPYGYSDNQAGFIGAALILSGLLAAIITAPFFDRVLTHHLALTARAVTPFLGAGWFVLIWAVRPNNIGALFALFVIIGVTSLTLLPVALDLAAEVTRNSDTSAAALWSSGNLFGFIFTIVQDHLSDGPNANPPFNYHRGLIFNGIVVLAITTLVQLLRGRQGRRLQDEEMNRRQQVAVT